MATALQNVIEQAIVQDIEPGIFDSLHKEDPVFADLMQSSFSVVEDSRGLGRNFVVQRVFEAGESGAGNWADALSGTLLADGDGTATGARVWGTPRAYPGHQEYAIGELLTRDFRLIRWNGNIFLDESVLLANELRATIADVVAREMRRTTRRFTRSMARSFYALNAAGTGSVDNVLGVIGTLHVDPDDSDSDLVDTNTQIKFNLSAGRLRNFQVGDFIEIWNGAGTERLHGSDTSDEALNLSYDSMLVVDSIDLLGGTIIARLHGGGDFSAEVSTGDLVIAMRDTSLGDDTEPLNTTPPIAPYGLNDWIKGSGTLFNERSTTGISLTTYPQFSSVTATISDTLTEQALNQFYARFWDAYSGRVELDTAITTIGVIIGYLAGLDGQYSIERQNMVARTKAGWKGFSYMEGASGREIDVRISPNVESGAWFSLQIGGGNIKMYTPPPIPGTKPDSRFGQFARFANLGSGLFKHYHGSGAITGSAQAGLHGRTTELREAPWHAYVNIVPDEVNGMKLSSITEVN